MLRDDIIRRDRTTVIGIEVVCQSDAMTGCHWCDLMLDIAEECHVTNRRLVLRFRKLISRVEGPFLTAVTKEQSSTLKWRWEDNYERAEHLIAAWRINVRLKE